MTNPKILMIIPKYDLTQKKFYHYLFPTGFAYIIAALKHHGYSVECLNLNHTEGKIKDATMKGLQQKEWDYILAGGIALDYHCLKAIFDTIECYKESKKMYKDNMPVTILGGMIITTEPELIYNDLKPDYGVMGEGEETIVDLIDTLEKKGDVSKVAGIVYREKT